MARGLGLNRERASLPPPVPDYWLRKLQPMPKTAGMHRINWDLHYEHPSALSHNYGQVMGAVYEDTPYTPEGPRAVPGRYTLKLAVDGLCPISLGARRPPSWRGSSHDRLCVQMSIEGAVPSPPFKFAVSAASPSFPSFLLLRLSVFEH